MRGGVEGKCLYISFSLSPIFSSILFFPSDSGFRNYDLKTANILQRPLGALEGREESVFERLVFFSRDDFFWEGGPVLR